jgi:prephenate dehydratase
MNQVSFLGPNGTFTHEAASTVSDNLISYCSIQSVMESVMNDECSKGIVPIENSIEGSVTLTLDLLVHKFDLMIEGEIIIPINHNLLVNQGAKIEDITDVYSHSQALAQCQPFLEDMEVNKHFSLSTAAAAKKVKGLNNSAAIGTLTAGKLYGLIPLIKNIQDNDTNQTRFIILSKNDHEPTGNDKTSIIFSLFDDAESGALYKVLEIFAKENISLTKIESRPSKEGLGSYLFFIDLEGHRLDDNISRILKEVKNKTSFFKILGSYPFYQ